MHPDPGTEVALASLNFRPLPPAPPPADLTRPAVNLAEGLPPRRAPRGGTAFIQMPPDSLRRGLLLHPKARKPLQDTGEAREAAQDRASGRVSEGCR